jgi:hypothetical protein
MTSLLKKAEETLEKAHAGINPVGIHAITSPHGRAG